MDRKKRCKCLDTIALILVLIGGLNWGMVGVSGFNLVSALSFGLSFLEKGIYILVGISAGFLVVRFLLKKIKLEH